MACVLSETLWAYRVSRHGFYKVTTFELVYRKEVVLPIEVNFGAYKLAKQKELKVIMYHDLKGTQH